MISLASIAIDTRLRELGQCVRGWIAYFCLEQRKTLFHKTLFHELDKWLRRRVRACYWKWWRLPTTKIRKLRFGNCDSEAAITESSSGGRSQPRLLSQRPLAHVRQPSDPNGHVHRMAASPRSTKPRRTLDTVCSEEMNRLVRTRMPGGVGGARSKPAPIAMIVIRRFQQQPTGNQQQPYARSASIDGTDKLLCTREWAIENRRRSRFATHS